MSKGPWTFKPKNVERAQKVLTDAGLKIVGAIFHPDGSFEFRTYTDDDKVAANINEWDVE